VRGVLEWHLRIRLTKTCSSNAALRAAWGKRPELPLDVSGLRVAMYCCAADRFGGTASRSDIGKFSCTRLVRAKGSTTRV